MKIEWKYAPAWASAVRKQPVTGKLAWCGYKDNGQCLVEYAVYLDAGSPVYNANNFESWPLVANRGEDVELANALVHVYTIGGHKLYAESIEAADLLKQLLVDRVNGMADHYELGE